MTADETSAQETAEVEEPVSDIVAQRPLRCLTLAGSNLESFLIAHPRVMFRLLQGEARKVRATTRWLN